MGYLKEHDEHKEKSTKAMLRLCKKYFGKEDKYLNATPAIAAALNYFDKGDEVGEMYLEWTVDEFFRLQIKKRIENIKFIYSQLVKHKFTEKNRYEYNDLDNHIFYLPCKKPEEDYETMTVFVMTSQTTNYIVVYKELDFKTKKEEKIYIYRYWDQYWDVHDKKDKWDIEEAQKYKNVEYAIIHSRWLVDRYSDNIKGNKYVFRPDLKMYKKSNFKTYYGDHRDGGFILGYNSFMSRDTGSIGAFYEINDALFQLKCAYEEMTDLDKK